MGRGLHWGSLPTGKRSRAPTLTRSVPVLEADVLQACLALLAVHPLVMFSWRANTGAVAHANADGGVRHVRFGFNGQSDVLGVLRGGRMLAVETKRPGWKPRSAKDRARLANQRAFLAAVNAAGGLGLMVDDAGRLDRALRAGVGGEFLLVPLTAEIR